MCIRDRTRKDGRLTCGIAPLDALLGGIARGRISEVTGPISSGKTTVAAAFASAASRRGEVVGWVDVPGAFDPRSVEAAGADLARTLWVSFETVSYTHLDVLEDRIGGGGRCRCIRSVSH